MFGRVVFWVVGAVLLGCGSAVHGQVSAGNAKQVLEGKLKGHSLLLRGFPGKTTVSYRWRDGHLVPDAQGVFTAGVLKVGRVKVHETNGVLDSLVLEGSRRVVMRSNGALGLSDAQQAVSLNILMLNAPATAIDELERELSFPTLDAMLEAVPTELGGMVPASVGVQRPSTAPGDPKTWIEEGGKWSHVPTKSGELQVAKVLFAPEPDFSEEARQSKASGTMRLALVMDTGGHVTETWLLQPAGFGLDENALKAGSGYRFSPATYKGMPVGWAIQMEVSFQQN